MFIPILLFLSPSNFLKSLLIPHILFPFISSFASSDEPKADQSAEGAVNGSKGSESVSLDNQRSLADMGVALQKLRATVEAELERFVD